MKLYPFLRANSYKYSSQQCFLSFLRYRGYDMDKDYLSHIFPIRQEDVPFSNFLEGLDYFSVLYENIRLDSFQMNDVSDIIIKQQNSYQLCCGRFFDYLLLMCPVRGYRLVKLNCLKEEGITNGVKIKFLGEFPYTSKEKQQIYSYWMDLLFALLGIMFAFMPIKNAFISYLLLFVISDFIFKHYGKYRYLKKEKNYEEFPSVYLEWQALMKVSCQKHYYLILLLETVTWMLCRFKTGFAMLLLVILLYFLSIKRFGIFPFFGLAFAYLLLAEVYGYIGHTLSRNFLLGVALSFIIFWLLDQYQRAYRHEASLELPHLEKWLFLNPHASKIHSVGFALYRFEKSTFVVGSYESIYLFFENFRKPKLMINDTLMERFDAITFTKDIVFQENFLHLALNKTVLEIFAERIDELLVILEKLDCFFLVLHLKRKVGALNKQERELFGFIDLYLKDVSFCVIEEAFIYQEKKVLASCLHLILQNKEVKFIISMPTITVNELQAFSLTAQDEYSILNIDRND